jgi:hypothetical protein
MLKPLSFNGKALVRTIDSDGYSSPHKFTISWTPTYYDSPSSIDPVYFNVATVYFANGQSKTFKSNQGPITHDNTVKAYGSEISRIDFVDSQYLDTVDFVSNYYVTPTESLFSGARTLRLFNGPMSMAGNTSAKNMFSGCYNLGGKFSQGAFHLVDCEGLTTLEGMFNGCYQYYETESTPMGHNFQFSQIFDSLASVTSMKGMFSGCTHLNMVFIPDIPSLDTPNLTDMSYMFYGTDIRNISENPDISLYISTLSGINTSNVTDMSYMFANTPNLGTWLEAPFDTHNVTNVEGMFAGSGIHAYDATGTHSVAHWDFTNVTNMSRFFSSCTNIVYPSIRNNFEHGDSLVNVSYMFNNCTSLIAPTLWFAGSSITNMSYMFNGCSSLTEIDFSRLSLTGTPTMTDMFKGCTSLEEVSLPLNVTENTLNLIKGRLQTDVGGTWKTRTDTHVTILYKE